MMSKETVHWGTTVEALTMCCKFTYRVWHLKTSDLNNMGNLKTLTVAVQQEYS